MSSRGADKSDDLISVEVGVVTESEGVQRQGTERVEEEICLRLDVHVFEGEGQEVRERLKLVAKGEISIAGADTECLDELRVLDRGDEGSEGYESAVVEDGEVDKIKAGNEAMCREVGGKGSFEGEGLDRRELDCRVGIVRRRPWRRKFTVHARLALHGYG